MLFLTYYTWQYKRQVVRNGMAKPVSKYCVVYTVFTAINAVLEYMFYVIYLKLTPPRFNLTCKCHKFGKFRSPIFTFSSWCKHKVGTSQFFITISEDMLVASCQTLAFEGNESIKMKGI